MNWSSLLVSASILADLSLPDPKHLCPTLGACATCGRPLVLHYNGLRVLDFDLVAATGSSNNSSFRSSDTDKALSPV